MAKHGAALDVVASLPRTVDAPRRPTPALPHAERRFPRHVTFGCLQTAGGATLMNRGWRGRHALCSRLAEVLLTGTAPRERAVNPLAYTARLPCGATAVPTAYLSR